MLRRRALHIDSRYFGYQLPSKRISIGIIPWQLVHFPNQMAGNDETFSYGKLCTVLFEVPLVLRLMFSLIELYAAISPPTQIT